VGGEAPLGCGGRRHGDEARRRLGLGLRQLRPPVGKAVAMVSARYGERVQRGFGAPGESPRQILSGGMAAAPSGVALPVEGVILEQESCCTSLWVKTRSSSWTSDGGACGRRDLLGGVVSRDTVRSAAWLACCSRLPRPAVTILSLDMRNGGCLPHAKRCSPVGGRMSSLAVVRLLAAFRGA